MIKKKQHWSLWKCLCNWVGSPNALLRGSGKTMGKETTKKKQQHKKHGIEITTPGRRNIQTREQGFTNGRHLQHRWPRERDAVDPLQCLLVSFALPVAKARTNPSVRNIQTPELTILWSWDQSRRMWGCEDVRIRRVHKFGGWLKCIKMSDIWERIRSCGKNNVRGPGRS